MRLKFEKSLFFTLIFIIIFILTYNILHYTPLLGYDAEAHINYVDHLSRYLPKKIDLPSDEETREFFNPPLAYLVPSLAQVICRNTIESFDFLADCRPIYAKATQIFQSILYLLTIFFNLLLLKKFNNQKSIINVGYLLLVSLLAANYRTISMIRGEPYILFFLSLFLLLFFECSKNKFIFDKKYVIAFGITIGLIGLSRQWGFLLFPPLIILGFFNLVIYKKDYFKFVFSSLFIGFLVSAWFYINLFLQYGSFTAFNKERLPFSFSNKPLNFYIPESESLYYLFYKPIRPHLNNQFITTLYSDLWGDYWGYFSFTSLYLDVGRNQMLIGDYLANVNKISLLTTGIIIFLYFKSNRHFKESFLVRYLNLTVVFSFIGFLWFLLSYYESTGDTIKATYFIHVFHLIILMASIYLQVLKNSNRKFYNFVLILLSIIFVLNFQTYLSHFPASFIENYRI